MTGEVVFLSYIDFSDSTAGASRSRLYSKMLRTESVKVTMYCIYDFYNSNWFAKKLNENRIVRNIIYPLRVFLYVMSIGKLMKNKDNVVFYLYPTTQVLLDYFLIIYLKFIRKRKVYLEVNEVRRYGLGVRSGSIKHFKYALHERLARYFDGLVCISKNIESYYRKYNKNILRIPILSDADHAYIDNCNYINGDVFNIGFTGSIDIGKENLSVFFSALQSLTERGYPVAFNLYGHLFSPDEFYKEVSLYNLQDVVRYHGLLSQDLLPDVMAKQDLLVLPRAENDQNKYGFSTKLAEYLLSGVPVLITDVSDNLLYLTDRESCIVADYRCSKSFAENISGLIENYQLLAPGIAENAFNVSKEKLGYRVHAKSFKDFLISGSKNQYD